MKLATLTRPILFFLLIAFPLSTSHASFFSKYFHHKKKTEDTSKENKSASSTGEPAAKSEGYTAKVSSEMKQAFKEADDLYKANNLQAAFPKFQDYLTRFAYTALSDAVLYRLADIADAQAHMDLSQNYLLQLIGKTPDPEWRERARLLLARSFFTKSEYQNAYLVLSQIEPTYLEPWQRVHFYCLFIRLEEKRKVRGPLYAYYMLRLKDAYADVHEEIPGATLPWIVPQSAVHSYIEKWIFTSEAPMQVPRGIAQYAGGAAEGDALLHMGVVFASVNDQKSAHRVLREFLARYGDHPDKAQAQALLDKMGNQAADEKYGELGTKIGVMLPLSGPYAGFGNAVLSGLRCGSGEESRCGQTSDIALVVRDNQDDPGLAEHIFSDFNDDDQIQAIVGPMSTKTSRGIMPLVKDHKNLAVLDMAQGNIGETLQNLFHIRLSPELQVGRLVDKAIAQGIKNVGILYPSNSYGEAMASAFAKALIARGGRVPARQSYDVATGDFDTAIRQLKLNVSYFAGGGTNGFQALFIPDSQNRVRKMVKPLSDQNMTGIPLIGTNAWSGEPFASDLELLFPGSYFSDVFFADDKRAQNFVKGFIAAYGHAPSSLEAMAYDLIRIANQALKNGGGKNRKALREALNGIKGYSGVTTIQGFDDNGEARFQVMLLTQKDGHWTPM